MEHRKHFLGPARWPQWLLCLFPFAHLFNKAAKLHDTGYAEGGDINRKIFEDDYFLEQTLKVCGYNPFAYLFANLYYCLVKWFGHKYFNLVE